MDKDKVIAKCEEIAETEHGRLFHELDDELKDAITNRASVEVEERAIDSAMERLKEEKCQSKTMR